jgi:nitroreductase
MISVVPDLAQRPLDERPLPADTVGLLEGLSTTRTIRRYTDEPVPPEALRAILFAATRAPSGSNRQAFRFLVLTDGPVAREAKRLIGQGARQAWGTKRENDGYAKGSGTVDDSPKARVARTMQRYVDEFETVPVLILPCLVRYRAPTSYEGASIFPSCQNILLAARALGYGAALTGWHQVVETELRPLLGVPDGVFMAATITIGRPEGSLGPVRRRPIGELIFEDRWGTRPDWAVDPPGTRHTAAGPPVPERQ